MRKIAWILFLVAGCDAHHLDHEGERKREQQEPVQVTAWSDRFEIFMEYPPVIANQAVTFVIHVTDVKTAEPRREGKVALRLSPDSGPEIEHVEATPRRPGIYMPAVTLPSPGTWKVAVRIPAEGAEIVVELPPLKVHASPEEARKAPRDEAPEGIHFLKEQQWILSTRSEAIGKRRMAERLRLPAVVLARPGSRSIVAPPLAGRILLPPGKSVPPLGGHVEAGELLAYIQPPVSDLAARIVEAEAEVAKTRLAFDQAELSHARVKKLAAAQAKTERELQESEFALQTAKVVHQAALALRTAYEKSGAVIRSDTGNLPVHELKSPIAGIITHIGAAAGEYVSADRALFTILDARQVLMEARIPESDVVRIGTSRDAVYETPDAKGRFVPILSDGAGRVVLLGPEVDPMTRSVPLIYEVRNPEGRLRIGMALNIYLETARAEDALAIPESALVDVDGRFVAFVQVSGETFQKRDLKLGIRDSGFAQILEGLSPGERVVTHGAYAVRLASVSSSLPAHGHSH